MSKTIVIQPEGWVATYHRPSRSYLTKLVFSLAAQHNWTVAMAGQRWRGDTTPQQIRHAQHVEPLTDEQWAMLMGRTPS